MRSIRLHNRILIQLMTISRADFDAFCQEQHIPFPVEAYRKEAT